MEPRDRLIVALDVNNEEKALHIVGKLNKSVRIFKIGLELFVSAGPEIVENVRKIGCEVFLDLKFHDIPNTVMKAAASVTRLKPFMFNVHATGGLEMMKRAAEETRKEAERLKIARPKILAVTVLTSMNEKALKEIGVSDSMSESVRRLTAAAKSAGLDGVVASPLEIELIRKEAGRDFLIVTPGVRPEWAPSGDQKRVSTPKEAISKGADFIVVGRPILDAEDPAAAADKILEEIK